MMRKLIVVGDPPAPGGAVLPYSGPMMDVFGHRIALIGGRAYCEGCNSVGIIAKAGGPRRGLFYGAEMALEGDVVICHCPVPPPLVATLVHNTNFDDMLGGMREYEASFATLPGWFAGVTSAVEASSKVVDELVEHPPEAERTENICPNMTNKEFCTLVLKLRDRAITLITKRRLPELERWDKDAQARVKEWFGVADQPIRQYLQKGFTACVDVLRGLDCGNFVRISELTKKNINCVLPKDTSGVAAAVCKPDVATHTIGININFCDLREFSAESDSKLLTLIHEVTHFDDCFGTLTRSTR
jgi:uncharacterized Zn-binding protein involved in type VI secretion